MVLTFAEDFTEDFGLDSQLLGTPDSGLFWNRGVHPSVTVGNLFSHLPKASMTFAAYDPTSIYGDFNKSRKKSDIVLYEDLIYQSVAEDHTGNTPGPTSDYWLETNINSLRIKSFIFSVEDNVLSALSINRMLIENQYLYNLQLDQRAQTPTGDFFGWAFEPKGSDYVKIRINQIALQANIDTPQSLYVINQGRLIDTLTLNPNNGVLEFEEVDYTFGGKGVFEFVIASQEVLTNGVFNDPLKYKGFVCYPITGTGSTAEGAVYNRAGGSNGLNFNVSCYLDSSVYIDNNKIDMGPFYRSQFEYDFIRLMTFNSNSRFNIEERSQAENPELLAAESLDVKSGTVARSYASAKKRMVEVINRTFDKFLQKKKGLRVKRTTI